MDTRTSQPLILQGKLVRLEPLEPVHIKPLMALARATPEAFKYTSTPITDAQRDSYFATAFALRESGEAYPFVIMLQGSGEIVGSSRLTDIKWHDRNCELGYSWLVPACQGSGVNAECKYLMLRSAFETLKLVRVQIHTDVRNRQSQAAIKRLGAVYEGVLRRHKVVKDGFVRDTMVFSVTDLDWPKVKEGLEERLARRESALSQDG